MSVVKNCSKCNSVLKEGFMYVRNNSDPSFFNYVVWVEGEKKDIVNFMRSNEGVPQFPVIPFKCENCGHIEFYAGEKEKWKR